MTPGIPHLAVLMLVSSQVEERIGQFQTRFFVDALCHKEGQLVRVLARRWDTD